MKEKIKEENWTVFRSIYDEVIGEAVNVSESAASKLKKDSWKQSVSKMEEYEWRRGWRIEWIMNCKIWSKRTDSQGERCYPF